MIKKWLEEDQYTSKTDQLMCVIYSLGITDRRQLQTVTGWTEMQIHGGLQRIRNLARGNETKDEWLLTWQPTYHSPYVYSLGEKGIQHVRALKEAAVKFDGQQPRRGQVSHFMGTNHILCRAIEKGYDVKDWMSAGETLSYLYYQLLPEKSPVMPDCTICIEGSQHYFGEFDTGKTSGGKLEDKFHKYLNLSNIIGEYFPVVWVTVKESRKQLLMKKAQDAILSYERKKKKPLPAKLPEMFFFVEGEETEFLAGKEQSRSIWSQAI
ncbi:replication-relaxation family protein [Risungbinella massiliensis]|uniref:replication-relaxation family protein n=1 Tax=Risungbinella massiliensis TaxID=1329796 RepID=UPI0005CB8F7D|nr:replication-relaxation family protein [Risungbinella massiliensis]